MADFSDDLKATLKAAGCEFIRQGKGSHEIWRSPISNKHFPVQHKIKSRHTANGVLGQAGLPKQF